VCDLLAILGFPARLTGGGSDGTVEVGRSPLRGSPVGTASGCEGKRGFESRAGVASRLGILKDLEPFAVGVAGDGGSNAVCASGRKGCGECISGSKDFGGDLGDCTMTLGGDLDLAADLGGEKAIIEVGLGFGLLHGMRIVLARGVTEPAPLKLFRLVELRFMWSRGMSNDLRPFALLSSETASRSVGAGERCRGVAGAGAGALLALSKFSKRARRSDTGFYMLLSACVSLFKNIMPHTMDEPSMFSSSAFSMVWVDLRVSRHQKVSYSCSSTIQKLFPLSAGCGVEEWW
jgi:hypothetical protein